MTLIKRLLKPVITALGYDIRKTSHVGLHAVNDIKQIYGRRSPRTILDVGAHCGETATLFSANFAKAQIHSFEPAPETFAQLQRNIDGLSNVRPVNAALGSKTGKGTLNINKFSATNSLLKSAPGESRTDAELMHTLKTTTISVRTVEDYGKEAGIDFIDLLKMDVQGFELEVLGGAGVYLTEERIALIYSEVLFEQLYEGQPKFEDVYQWVTHRGFKLVGFYGEVRSSVQGLRWCDALFVHPAALAKAGL